jgi:ABC-2 type transport system permease protein
MSGPAESAEERSTGRRPRLSLPSGRRRARPLEIDGRPSIVRRVYGLGSVYGKGLRDSRRAILLGGLGVGLIVLFTASQVAAEFGTPLARAAMALLPTELPVAFRGLLGEPYSIEKLGGFLSWRTLNFMPVLLGGWSVAALSGTLAGEAARGSLDLVLATPRSRTSVALQKALAHVTAVLVAATLIGVFTYVATQAFATLPGDQVEPGPVAAHMIWFAAMVLFPGSVAWAVAPVVGRAAAAGIGAIVLVASFVVHGYKEAIPAFESLDRLSYFGLTAGHRPIAGVYDWPSVAVLWLATLALLVVGAAVFARRDVGVVTGTGLRLPRLRLGLGDPLGRSFAERLPVALSWGLGLGAIGLVFALSTASFITAFKSIPNIQVIVERFYPGVDLFSAGGILQLVYFGFGALLIAVAAGMVAAGWASDETERRLEIVLSAPTTRRGWALRSGTGAMLAMGLMAVLGAAPVAVGAALQGDNGTQPFAGGLVLGVYGAALAGIGIAVAGLVRPTLALGVAVGLGVAFYLLDTLGAALRLPDWVLDLSLTQHLGQPMAGIFDPVGTTLCAALAVGGVVAGAWGLDRRDVGR